MRLLTHKLRSFFLFCSNPGMLRLVVLPTQGKSTGSLCPSEDVIETPHGHINRSSSILLVKCLIIIIIIIIILILI
jgi:hypothetical protein